MRHQPVLALGCLGAALAGVAVASMWPDQIWLLFAALALTATGILALLCPTPALLAWLLAVGLTPDMWCGPESGMAMVAALKLTGLVLVAICALRFGLARDPFNPGFAFLAMAGWSVVHGLHPSLDWAESARSLLGSAAPFALGFVRLPRASAQAVIRTVTFVPLASVALGMALAAAGRHPLFIEGAGLRLQGAGHPAFLAGFAMAACYAGLLEWLRDGRARHAVMLGLNLAILALTGARAPLAITLAVILLALLLAPSPRLGWMARLPVLLGGSILALSLALLADGMAEIRIFNLLLREPANLSGRDAIWPVFLQAWEDSPWLGWGVGAAKSLVALDSPVARLLGTNAAHNEYLRIGVEGGYLGLGLLVLALALWARAHLRATRGADRVVLLLVLIGFAVHSYTDNTLIATTSSIFLTWIIACFARAARDHEGATPS